MDWARENDELAHRMVRANREFAANIFSRTAMVYYTRRLMLSYIHRLHKDHRPAVPDPKATFWTPQALLDS